MDKTPIEIAIVPSLASLVSRVVVCLMMFSVMIGLGVVVGSSAMQWIGGVFFLIWLTTTAKMYQKGEFQTIAQARAKLDEIEGRENGSISQDSDGVREESEHKVQNFDRKKIRGT